MVEQLTSSGAGVDAVEGVAGSGKTYALAAARDAWHASGYRVIGCALAARAAAQLEKDAAIVSMTLDRLFNTLDTARISTDHGTVIVVDEAAMVGTRKLARLLDHAEATNVKVVLIGDHHQLPEIDAGGAFAGIVKRLHGTRLVQNHRQLESWERHALAQLRDGDVDHAFAMYQAHGRVVHLDDPEQLRERLVDDWWAARNHGADALMLASRNAEVDDLNQRARRRLILERQLGAYDFVVNGRGFAIGDEILTTRNDYRVGVLNGTRGRISDIDHSRGELRINADGHEVMLPQSYVAAGHVTHAYAVTFHKAQGMTTRDAFILVDNTLDRERVYTGLSRRDPQQPTSTSPTLPTNAPRNVTHPNQPTTPSHEHANRCDTPSPNQWPSTSTTRTELKPADQSPHPTSRRHMDLTPVQTSAPETILPTWAARSPSTRSVRAFCSDAYLNTHAERQIWRVA